MEIKYNTAGYPIELSHPRLLFKYAPDNDNTISALSESYLWFSNASSFNDPFEFQNALSKTRNKKAIRKLLKQPYPNATRRQLGILADKFQKDADLQRSIINSIHEDEVSKTFVSCLTEDCTNVLMWSHYANSHKGLCLVLDFNELFGSGSFTATKIEYVDTPRIVDFAELYARPPVPRTDHEIKQILFGTKLKQWGYEQEFRMLSDKFGKNPITPRAFVGVVFGAKASESFRASVTSIVEEKYANTKVVDAKLNGTKGTIDVSGFHNRNLRKSILGYSGNPAEAHTAYYSGPN